MECVSTIKFITSYAFVALHLQSTDRDTLSTYKKSKRMVASAGRRSLSQSRSLRGKKEQFL